MSGALPRLDNEQARRLFLDRHALLRPGGGPGRGADLAGVIETLGFVQLDSVNTFARAHDLILWSRRQQFRPPALNTALAQDRTIFEHWTHDAAAIPMAFYPYWRLKFERDAARLQGRWQKNRREGFVEQIDEILDHVARHGACTTRDVGKDEEKSSGGWWDWHPSKTALEYLWRSGALAVTRREGFRKVYDLTERVIPSETLARRKDDDEIIDWACRAALDRMGFGTSGEIAAFWDIITKAEAARWCRSALQSCLIEEVEIVCADGSRRVSLARPGVVDEALSLPEPSTRVRILSPFDPALRDRARAERLFDFSYRIEIFVPEPKRVYGYYVFPVMEGTRLIGRIDMKADRSTETLWIRAFWPEDGVRMGKGRQAKLVSELERAAGLGACRALDFAEDWLRDPVS
ncbi:YcaQ family DNA glycosylase [Ponticoccus sp. SC2-23]|uniref:winged helix-turn-helix domain-containing protein n=1 Tax=Alexandriicola marinus TaxID=2081710 RepID=UPI000FD882F2|nr:crosslink repair DNA glycosylase YcaQ family protein [Alexandriicola marinus]MBM1221897.1 YcaQ family DNA glycosylase [Ponticoccus sp. SC6-9]MBM1226248.1 YcaQ family DNA glycosylase [Ponticoccus sp. SC6-15]MBM1230844.1 YcaQ family DNA glycosylase [Ponticoccus sp. SC6-38]MBM1235315.1 YcaQ family DNA glycosylase [Ponticoccus sp. SC6-45]MBM1239866.1 YcaQ family DNA glycosylase [Ponticoccus sp. SC6-49]MBM1244010.1 YcaQ family DNA glycosylase [Ponticoccus sp. SC2-64]MBM1248839.1 YcaQ family DN